MYFYSTEVCTWLEKSYKSLIDKKKEEVKTMYNVNMTKVSRDQSFPDDISVFLLKQNMYSKSIKKIN